MVSIVKPPPHTRHTLSVSETVAPTQEGRAHDRLKIVGQIAPPSVFEISHSTICGQFPIENDQSDGPDQS